MVYRRGPHPANSAPVGPVSRDNSITRDNRVFISPRDFILISAPSSPRSPSSILAFPICLSLSPSLTSILRSLLSDDPSPTFEQYPAYFYRRKWLAYRRRKTLNIEPNFFNDPEHFCPLFFSLILFYSFLSPRVSRPQHCLP